MARSPVPVSDVPFSEAGPLDDLEVEAFGDDEVLIGDPSTDDVEKEEDNEFDSNLAEIIDVKELNATASSLIGNYMSDKSSRSEWEERYKNGLRPPTNCGGCDAV